MAEIYFSGQGVVHIAVRDGSGNATIFRDLGNVPALRLTLETDVLEHKESRTGNRLTDLRLQREKRARVTMTLESFNKANLMMLMYGSSATVASGTASAELLPTGLVAGDSIALSFPLVNVWTSLVDSTGSPQTLIEGSDYRIDKNSGMVTILDPTGFVQPFKANYSYLGEDIVPFFEQSQTERFLRFSGLNTANGNKAVVVELYRVVFDPVGTFDLINDEFAQFEIEGSVLYDSARDSNDSSGVLGGFGRIIQAP
jgi:hypothetical protein